MADTKISALTAATTPLAGTEVLPIVQSGVTKQVSIANLTAGRAVSAASLTLTGSPLAVASGGTGLTSLTANQVLYGSFLQSSNLFFDGTVLGVGTSSPSGFATRLGILNGTVVCAASSTSYTAYFGVQNDLNYSGGMSLRPSNYSTYGAITANCLNFYYGSGNIVVSADGNNNVILAAGSGAPNRLQVHYGGGVSIGNTTDPGAKNLSVSGAMAINGAIASSVELAVYQDLGGVGDAALFKDTGSAYGSGAVYIRFTNNAGSTAGKIEHTASTTVNYNTASDQRLKIDKGVATDTSVIDNTIIHDYEWIEDGRIDRGVFAQEAVNIKPSAISVGDDKTNENGALMNPWGVDYSKYVPDLIVYCQQLKAEVSSLKSKLKDAGVAGF